MKVVSLNIEGDTHLSELLRFLQKEAADVVCLQEVFGRDLATLEEGMGMRGVFAPTTMRSSFLTRTGPLAQLGVVLLSRPPFSKTQTLYYYRTPGDIPESESNPTDMTKHWRVLVAGEVEQQGVAFTFATTHLTWTPDGQATDTQREHLRALLRLLEGFGEVVLCGDFNAPRGMEIFGELAGRYKDNIPPKYTTSIDGALHKAGALQLMVDGLFTTPGYLAEHVRLVGGVSDHLAVVADIARSVQ